LLGRAWCDGVALAKHVTFDAVFRRPKSTRLPVQREENGSSPRLQPGNTESKPSSSCLVQCTKQKKSRNQPEQDASGRYQPEEDAPLCLLSESSTRLYESESTLVLPLSLKVTPDVATRSRTLRLVRSCKVNVCSISLHFGPSSSS
jgi:hypothetical protein